MLGEELLSPYISYEDVRNTISYSSNRFTFSGWSNKPQERFNYLEELRNDPANARLFLIVIRHREIKMAGDGNKITEIKFI